MTVFENYGRVLFEALKTRGLTGTCPMCKKNQWAVHDVPVSMPVYEASGTVQYPGTSMPMAAVICRSCGFAGFFSLGVLGLVKAPGGSPSAPAPSASASTASDSTGRPSDTAALGEASQVTPDSADSAPVAEPPPAPAPDEKKRKRRKPPTAD